jgi:hypothetical protein
VLFLNKIQDKVDSGDPLYQGIDVRLVALYDNVPSDMFIGHQLVGRSLDTVGYLGSLTLWSPDTYARNANDSEFLLPKGMKFKFKPYHLVALDEQRKEFAVTDLQGADQEGLKGVHSNVGGGYGGSLFEMIARNAVLDRAQGFGLNIFRRDVIELNASQNYARQGQYASDRVTYETYMKTFGKQRVSPSAYSDLRKLFKERGVLPNLIDLAPTDNSKKMFNDNEPRHLPEGLTLHPSVMWFLQNPLNAME